MVWFIIWNKPRSQKLFIQASCVQVREAAEVLLGLILTDSMNRLDFLKLAFNTLHRVWVFSHCEPNIGSLFWPSRNVRMQKIERGFWVTKSKFIDFLALLYMLLSSVTPVLDTMWHFCHVMAAPLSIKRDYHWKVMCCLLPYRCIISLNYTRGALSRSKPCHPLKAVSFWLAPCVIATVTSLINVIKQSPCSFLSHFFYYCLKKIKFPLGLWRKGEKKKWHWSTEWVSSDEPSLEPLWLVWLGAFLSDSEWLFILCLQTHL